MISPTIEENIQKLEEMTTKALKWSQTHVCKFDIGKFQLVHFTRNERKYTPLSLNVADHTVIPATTAKYLEIILDRKLRWKEHAEDVTQKGTKTIMAINRLSKTNFRLPHHLTQQLYTAVVLLKIEYGLPVWYEPIREREEGKRRKESVGMAKRVGKVQRIATRIIMGGLRTTATDVLDYHAALPPIHLRLNHTVFNAAVRLATLPPQHPLQRHVKCCTSYYPKYHHSPIHEIMNAFPQIRDLEVVNLTPKDPWWTSGIEVVIAESKESAKKRMKELELDLEVYTDGSGYRGGIGVAAWAETKEGEEYRRQVYLGPETNHTVIRPKAD